jgi:hypothetical protein
VLFRREEMVDHTTSRIMEDGIVRDVRGNIQKGRRRRKIHEALSRLLFLKKQAINLTKERRRFRNFPGGTQEIQGDQSQQPLPKSRFQRGISIT